MAITRREVNTIIKMLGGVIHPDLNDDIELSSEDVFKVVKNFIRLPNVTRHNLDVCTQILARNRTPSSQTDLYVNDLRHAEVILTALLELNKKNLFTLSNFENLFAFPNPQPVMDDLIKRNQAGTLCQSDFDTWLTQIPHIMQAFKAFKEAGIVSRESKRTIQANQHPAIFETIQLLHRHKLLNNKNLEKVFEVILFYDPWRFEECMKYVLTPINLIIINFKRLGYEFRQHEFDIILSHGILDSYHKLEVFVNHIRDFQRYLEMLTDALLPKEIDLLTFPLLNYSTFYAMMWSNKRKAMLADEESQRVNAPYSKPQTPTVQPPQQITNIMEQWKLFPKL